MTGDQVYELIKFGIGGLCIVLVIFILCYFYLKL